MKILLATGGSGGHIFPALKTAEALKRKGHDVVFAGALASAEERIRRAGFSVIILDVEGLSTSSLGRICSFGWRTTKAVFRSLGIVRSFKPDTVVGFGGYSSFPVVCAARLCGVPVMVHEQNVIPGKANKLSARLVRRIAVTFKETGTCFPRHDIVWTGCPCNDERPLKSKEDILAALALEPNRLTILVLGGSQGSRYLNEVFFETLGYWQVEEKIQVIHVTGRIDYSLYAEKYRPMNIPHHVCAFMENIEEAYTVAEIVVARAGAATVCELAAFGLPSVLVPYPFAHSHQTANAAVLEQAGASVVIEQKDLSRKTLLEALRHIKKQPATSSGIRERVRPLFVDHPAEQLVGAIESLKR